MNIKPFHLALILAHMLQTPSVMLMAQKNLYAAYLRAEEIGGSRFYGLMFDIILSHYTKFKVPPDRATLEAELHQIMKNYWSSPDEPEAREMLNDLQRFFWFLDKVEPHSAEVAKQMIAEIVKVCVHDVAFKKMLDEASNGQGLEELPEKLLKLRNERRMVTGGAPTNGVFTNRLQGKLTRVTTGIDYLDKRLGNGAGPYAYCGVGLLAAQGAGKTSHAIQFCVSQVLLGKPSLLVITESGWDATLQAKVLACLTGIPVEVIDQYDGNPIEAARHTQGANVELVEQKIKLLDKFFHKLDMVVEPGGMDSIKVAIDRVALEHGVPPAVTVIDWAGPLANYLMATEPKRFERKEAALKHIGGQVAEIGDRMKTLCVVTHQMAPAQILKGPTATSDHYVSQDCKGFTESFRYVITINKAHEQTRIQKMGIPKAREDRPDQIILVKLDYATCTFKEVFGWRQLGKHFRPVSLNANELPTETSKRNATAVE